MVLDLADDIYGFPCLREDDPLLDLVAPPVDDSPFPNAEERRLFYVGMTRGKKATYLVADPNRPSPFIRELLQIAPEVRELGQLSPKVCLVQRRAPGAFPNRQQPAMHELPSLPALGTALHRLQGRIRPGEPERYTRKDTETRCTNDACAHKEQVCPSCRRGVLTLRSNATTGNRFWACSQWQGGTGCTFTKDAGHADGEQSRGV